MMFEFTGTYEHSLDTKGRLTLPASFREHINSSKEARLAVGLNRYIAIYPLPVWLNLLENMKSVPKTDQQALAFKRVLFPTAYPCDVDGQGRILVPASLREIAAIVREVTVIGQQDYIEVWDRAKWKEYFRESLEKYEQNAGNLHL